MKPTSLLLPLIVIACGPLFAAEKIPTTKPNVLFIVGDDMGYGDVGFHKCKDIPTPNLDALAASGVRFTNGYVSGPYCSPTRAGLLTGRYQTRFGHEFNPSGGQGLPLSETTIANRMKAAGYVTGIVGKWHLGAQEAMHPQKRGFDEFFGFLGGAHSYFQRRRASCAARRRSRNSTTRRMRSVARPSPSSSGTRRSRGFSTSRSTPSTRRWTQRMTGSQNFQISPTSDAGNTTQ